MWKLSLTLMGLLVGAALDQLVRYTQSDGQRLSKLERYDAAPASEKTMGHEDCKACRDHAYHAPEVVVPGCPLCSDRARHVRSVVAIGAVKETKA